MKIQSVRSMYAEKHCTYKGTMMASREPHRVDIITPGASTVAEFKTVKKEFARFNGSQTERQVNALIMSWISLSHPKPASYQLCHLNDFAVTRLGVNYSSIRL